MKKFQQDKTCTFYSITCYGFSQYWHQLAVIWRLDCTAHCMWTKFRWMCQASLRKRCECWDNNSRRVYTVVARYVELVRRYRTRQSHSITHELIHNYNWYIYILIIVNTDYYITHNIHTCVVVFLPLSLIHVLCYKQYFTLTDFGNLLYK